MIAKIYLFRDKEAFFHADAEISYPLHLFPLRTIADGKLWNPNAVDKSLLVFNDVVEDEIQENKQLHSHQFEMLSIGQEYFYLWIMRIEDVDILLSVDGRAENQYLLSAIYAKKFPIHKHASLHIIF